MYDILNQINLTILGISGVYIGIYITVFLGYIKPVKNLEKTQKKSIHAVLCAYAGEDDICKIIDFLRENNPYLLLSPERKGKAYDYSFYFFIFVSLLALFIEPVSNGSSQARNIMVSIYFFSLALSIWFMCFEARFFNAFHELHNKYVDGDNIIREVKIVLTKPAPKG